MTFISYAQNFEDVILWRVLNHVKNGTYIDVGANDPVADSVTNAFYQQNWKGINIEPSKDYWIKLQNARPRDINLCLAVGSTEGEMILNIVDNTGLNTLHSNIADAHIQLGRSIVKKVVQVRSLNNILMEYPLNDIHFIKIDVEGHELEVLEGLNLRIRRPWVIVVEAMDPTSPHTQISIAHRWQHLLINNEYILAYSDGLNEFYLANEKIDLLERFRYPPNWFDHFILAEHDNAARQLFAANEKMQEIQRQNKALTDEIGAMHATVSWRVTRPLRWVRRIVRSL